MGGRKEREFMRTVSWMWFWYFLFGFITGGGAVQLRTFLKKKSMGFCWYEWIMSAVAFLLLILVGQTFIASIYEGELRAAGMSLVFIGVPMFLVAVGTYRSVHARLKKG
jgi:fatty acid desaturase